MVMDLSGTRMDLFWLNVTQQKTTGTSVADENDFTFQMFCDWRIGTWISNGRTLYWLWLMGKIWFILSILHLTWLSQLVTQSTSCVSQCTHLNINYVCVRYGILLVKGSEVLSCSSIKSYVIKLVFRQSSEKNPIDRQLLFKNSYSILFEYFSPT